MTQSLFMTGDATFSPCGRYRYSLSRSWDPTLPRACWIMLNPSRAGAVKNDPTITRVIGFSSAFGFGSFVVVNLYAYIATDPIDLLKEHRRLPEMDIIGPDNFTSILNAAKGRRIIVGWGAIRKRLVAQAERVLELVEGDLHCLGTTDGGFPKHPLYLPNETELQLFARAKA